MKPLTRRQRQQLALDQTKGKLAAEWARLLKLRSRLKRVMNAEQKTFDRLKRLIKELEGVMQP